MLCQQTPLSLQYIVWVIFFRCAPILFQVVNGKIHQGRNYCGWCLCQWSNSIYQLMIDQKTNFLLVTCYSILAIRYFLLVTRQFLLVPCYFLLVTRYFLLVILYLLLVTTFLLIFTCYSLLYSLYSLLDTRHYLFVTPRYLILVTTYSLLITFFSLLFFIYFYYLLVKLWKLSNIKNLNISQYASNLHIKLLKEFQNLFQLSLNNFISPRNAVKLIEKTYVSPHLKHFSKYKAAIYEFRVAFESLHAWLKRTQYCFI